MSCYTRVFAAVFAVAFVPASVNAGEIFSVNLWTWGKPSNSVWTNDGTTDITQPGYDPDLDTLFLGPTESAGVPGLSETTGWQNVEIRSLGSADINNGNGGNLNNGDVTINGSEGSTATFQVLEKRNESPYQWNSVRNTANDVNTGNATLLDAKITGTQTSGSGSGEPLAPNVFGIYQWDNIPFSEYSLVIYLSMNGGQFGDGTGTINSAELTGGLDYGFDIPNGHPNGLLDEVESDGDMGNYVVFEGLTASTITATINGNGFNHGGPAGFQIIDTSIPEPSSLIVLGMGSVLLVALRRRA